MRLNLNYVFALKKPAGKDTFKKVLYLLKNIYFRSNSVKQKINAYNVETQKCVLKIDNAHENQNLKQCIIQMLNFCYYAKVSLHPQTSKGRKKV